jgi:hypothetical protein
MLRTRKNMSLLETPKFIYGVPLPTAYFPLPFMLRAIAVGIAIMMLSIAYYKYPGLQNFITKNKSFLTLDTSNLWQS